MKERKSSLFLTVSYSDCSFISVAKQCEDFFFLFDICLTLEVKPVVSHLSRLAIRKLKLGITT